MAIINTKPDMNMGIWAEGGNIEIPSDTKIDEGWVVEKPLNEYMNFVQNRQDRMLQYINQRGIPEWDLRTEYPTNAHVARAGKIYKALSLNTDADPLSNPLIWVIAFASYEEFLSLFNDVDRIKTEEGYLEKYVSKQNPVLSGKALGQGYLNDTGTAGFDFDGSAPVIKQDTGGQVTFGVTDAPSDVVTFEKLEEYVANLIRYKVGDLYITTNPLNPTTTLGYGSWERYAEGKALVGVSSKETDPDWTRGVSISYGSYTHKLIVDEMPSHSHDIRLNAGDSNGSFPEDTAPDAQFYTGSTEATGGDQPHNNVQPSITVFVWRRTA